MGRPPLEGSEIKVPQPLDVFGIGHALVDLEVEVDEAFIESQPVPKGGWKSVTDPERAQLMAALEGREVHRCSGGSVANTAVGVAALGGRGGFCGKVGADELGEFFRWDQERHPVPFLADPGDGVTGTSTIVVTSDAQRTMATHHGITADLGPEDIDADTLGQATYLLVEGYLLPDDRTRDAVMEAVHVAQRKGVRVALTVSASFIAQTCHDLLWELIEGPVDLLFLNGREARALTGREDPDDCAREIHRHSASVVLTLGADGSLLLHRGQRWTVDAVPVAAVDSTGATDSPTAWPGLRRGVWGPEWRRG